MKNDQVKEAIKDHLEDYARETGRGDLIRCLNPSHEDKHPSMSLDKEARQYYCFTCKAKYDIFSLYALDHGLDNDKDFYAMKEELAKKYNIKKETLKTGKARRSAEEPQKKKRKPNFSKYYKECHEAVGKTNYFKERGLTKEIVDKYNLGYNVATGYAVLPVSSSFYMERDTRTLDEEERRKQGRYKHTIPKGANLELFNLDLFKETNYKSVIFITESVIDALSIEVVSPKAKVVALNGIANASKVVEEALENNFKGYLVLALDNDKNQAGQRASQELKEELEAEGIKVIVLNKIELSTSDIYQGHKDLNEFLQADAEALGKLINDKIEQLTYAGQKEAEKILAQDNALNYLGTFNEITIDQELATPTKTDIPRLDLALNGGLFKKNLVILGAISGLGKTTLALQIADNIARNKEDVLIFSLEMSKEELIAKSISRAMYQLADKKPLCLSTREILTGEMYRRSEEIKELYAKAYNDYKENIAPNLFITECNENNAITIAEIEERIKRQIDITERKPLVVIDYLQIIENKEHGLTDIQATGKIVKDLKRLARKYKITILVISAFNRGANYSDTDYTSFRDTSTIEYTADVLLTLQYSALDQANDTEGRESDTKLQKKIKKAVEEASKKDPTELTLKILKNRNGKKNNLAGIEFFGANNYLDFKSIFDYED